MGQHHPVDGGSCLRDGRVPDPDNPVMLIDCPRDSCDNCPYYATAEQLSDLLII